MRRSASPWYRAGKRSWFVTLDGRQIDLGVSDPRARDAAIAALTKLLESLGKSDALPPPAGPTVAAAVAAFILDRAPKVASSTLKSYRAYLKRFTERWGTVLVPGLSLEDVTAEAMRRPTWGDDTRRNYLAAVECCLRHAGRPVQLDKPARGSAGPESVIAEAVYWQAIGAARGDVKQLLAVLWNTGARPSEVSRLTAEVMDWKNCSVTYKQHKTKKRSGKVRVIHFPPDAMQALDAQRKKYGSGLLFRTRRGSPWACPVLTQAVWRIGKRIGHSITAYGMRHTFATTALEVGLPDTHVAALLGHGSTRMLHHHYSHITANARLLKDAAERVRPAAG